jgi:Type ISP C-terminal specificity domain
MFGTFEDVPINVCFLARGCTSRPQGLMQSIEAGAGGLKIHEDLGAFLNVIDCCLSVAEQMDVSIAMHTAVGHVWINRTQYFDTVPLEVWEFHIGGYQVCHKWLINANFSDHKFYPKSDRQKRESPYHHCVSN